MSLQVTSVDPYQVRKEGIIPFVCEHWEGKPLFIIKGCVQTGLVANICGQAYKYENFPWPKDGKWSKAECREIADRNTQDNSLWIDDKVVAQCQRILGEKKT